jgi:serine/threonine-protein kinase
LLGTAAGPNEAQALAILEQAAGSSAEREAIAAVASAMAERDIPDAIAARCAILLEKRGDRLAAVRMLEHTTRPSDLMLRADLLCETGDLAQAVAIIERLIARQIDYPGAKERHDRWRTHLNPVRPPARGRDDVTLVLPADRKTPFRILREVARGGAGTIYEAHDDVLGRQLAFKVYHRPDADRGQLEREARLAVALQGPGVVRVYDASFADGWLAIEWIPRGSLRDLIASGQAQERTPIARWAKPLARALARVHSAGLVHADVKPSNVLLRSLEEPVLCDFGIAVPSGAPSEGGSAGYLSAERIAGKPVTPADDVYAFGRVLEDALVGVTDREMQRLSTECLLPERLKDASAILRLMG